MIRSVRIIMSINFEQRISLSRRISFPLKQSIWIVRVAISMTVISTSMISISVTISRISQSNAQVLKQWISRGFRFRLRFWQGSHHGEETQHQKTKLHVKYYYPITEYSPC